MNAKERFYSGLAKETIGKITSNTDNWTSFLRTMSRNYEFTYPEQVMIYAQRPNATFCKPYEDWNAENYRRYVKRGSTGIALFVMNRDKPYEQPESTGGGSRDDGAYQQLSLNLFLSENEQISFIDRAESFTPSAFSFAQEEIDHFLLLGSNTDEARKVVALEYMKQKPLEEIVQTLKQVYHGGYGLKEDSGNICAWYAEDGIHLAKGSSAIDSPRAQIVSWETVAERIGELLENGRFATNVELVEASGYERQKLAESLWHLYHDLSEEARSSNYLAILHQEPFRGFPDETADLAEKLDDPRFHATLVQQYSEFRKTLAENPDLLRFHYHKLNLIQKQLYELNMPLREYQTDMMQMPLVRQFITDDEVNADLTRGSGFSGGKARIYNYWQENHSAKEKMDFLKHEYGTGGHSHDKKHMATFFT